MSRRIQLQLESRIFISCAQARGLGLFYKNPKMCLFPQTIRNPRYKGGIAPQGLGTVTIKCGVCIECRQARAREWQQRIEQEIKNPENKGFKYTFVTFTIDEPTTLEFGIDYSEKKEDDDLQKQYAKENEMTKTLVSRWRRKCQKRNIKQKHFFITEHGKTRTERIHIHGIIWYEPEKEEELKKTWPWGIIDIGEFRPSTVPYIVKYIHKIQEGHPTYKAMTLVTPGIGKCYIKKSKENGMNAWKGKDTNMTYKQKNGTKVALCDYYKRKLFTEKQLEEYRLQLKDEGRRWVRKIEFDLRTRKGKDNYARLLKQEQEAQPWHLRPSFVKSNKNSILQQENQ